MQESFYLFPSCLKFASLICCIILAASFKVVYSSFVIGLKVSSKIFFIILPHTCGESCWQLYSCSRETSHCVVQKCFESSHDSIWWWWLASVASSDRTLTNLEVLIFCTILSSTFLAVMSISCSWTSLETRVVDGICEVVVEILNPLLEIITFLTVFNTVHIQVYEPHQGILVHRVNVGEIRYGEE